MSSQGFLLLNKPFGMRSTHCVESVRRALGRGVKTGHGGTLDSTASGLLVLLIGGATRLSSLVMQMSKVYTATVKLGYETSTCDSSGETTFGDGTHCVDDVSIDSALMSFFGWRMQVPPEISAVHVGGRRAHEITRSGGSPDLKPKAVFIESICRTSFLSREGEFDVRIRCGKGTYVRSIARDIGRRLGCGGHLTALRRESIGHFCLEGAIRYEDLQDSDKIQSAIIPFSSMGEFLPAYEADEEIQRRLMHGLDVVLDASLRRTYGNGSPGGIVMFASDDMISVGHMDVRGNRVHILPDINIKYKEVSP